MNTVKILSEVNNERKSQKGKWGDKNDDDLSPLDWHETISDYNGWARRKACMEKKAEARKTYIKIAAIAVAAVEAMDRKQKQEEIDLNFDDDIPF